MAEPIVELAADAQENGLACMLADLVRDNLRDHPRKTHPFGRLIGRVAMIATDIDVSVTLKFQGGRLTIHSGIFGVPDVIVRTSSDFVTKLSLVELATRLELPNPRGPVTRELLRASWQGRIQIHGLLPNLPLMWRLTQVMSVS